MKKSLRLLSALALTATLLVGCGKGKADQVASMSNEKTAVATAGKLSTKTLGDLYEQLYTNSEAFSIFVGNLARQELLKDNYYTEAALNAELAERRNDYLEQFLDEDTYKDSHLTNGSVAIFNEEILAKSLRASGYTIPCTSGYGPEIDTNNYTYKEGKIFKCDYSELYADVVDNSILKTLLVEKYSSEVKKTLLDKNPTVKVNYLAIPASNYDSVAVTHHDTEYSLTTTEPDNWDTVYDTYYRIVGESYVLVDDATAPTWTTDTFYKKVQDAYDSESIVSNRAKVFLSSAVSSLKAGKTLAEIEREWKDIRVAVETYNHRVKCTYEGYKSEHPTGQTYNWEQGCNSYTNNGAYRDTDGLKLKLKDIEETTYSFDEVITSSYDKISSSIVSTLFDKNVKNRLHELVADSGKYYLVDSSVKESAVFTDGDIIVSDSEKSSYYIIEVETISKDSEDTALVKEAIKYLAANNSAIINDALVYYLDKAEITIHDKKFYAYLTSSYPKVEFDY